ncbi:UNVERIFIED_ORG: hypothetical protein M2154_001882 [Enterobacter sp. JUb101]|nr:hypothetical protein [Lelliottia amnigena]
MARQTKPLSVKEIESAKPKEADYELYDGDGLELLIKSSGSKIWQFRYIRLVTKKRAKRALAPTRQLRLPMPETIEHSLALSLRNKSVHRNISKKLTCLLLFDGLPFFNAFAMPNADCPGAATVQVCI